MRVGHTVAEGKGSTVRRRAVLTVLTAVGGVDGAGTGCVEVRALRVGCGGGGGGIESHTPGVAGLIVGEVGSGVSEQQVVIVGRRVCTVRC